jgi:hypothetical protein
MKSMNSSAPFAGTTCVVGISTTRSGLKCHMSSGSNCLAGGMSAMLPFGAPWSTHAAIVAISSSVSDGSSMIFCMPILRSTCHGGIARAVVLALIERA